MCVCLCVCRSRHQRERWSIQDRWTVSNSFTMSLGSEESTKAPLWPWWEVRLYSDNTEVLNLPCGVLLQTNKCTVELCVSLRSNKHGACPSCLYKTFQSWFVLRSTSYNMLNPAFVTTPHQSRGEWSYVKLEKWKIHLKNQKKLFFTVTENERKSRRSWKFLCL